MDRAAAVLPTDAVKALVEDEAGRVHMQGMTTTRTTYRIEQVRAQDLTDTDVAFIEGRWREVADAHTAFGGTWDEVRNFYGPGPAMRILGPLGEDGPVGQVLLRFLLTGANNTGGIDDDFVLLDKVELVQIQVANATASPLEGF